MSDEKNYKSHEDPERAFYLLSALNIMRDHPKTVSLAATFARELNAMNLRVEELMAEEKKTKEEEAKAKLVEVRNPEPEPVAGNASYPSAPHAPEAIERRV